MSKYHISGTVHVEYAVLTEDYVTIRAFFAGESKEDALKAAVRAAESVFDFADTIKGEWDSPPEITCPDDPTEIVQQDTYQAMVAAGMPTLPGCGGTA